MKPPTQPKENSNNIKDINLINPRYLLNNNILIDPRYLLNNNILIKLRYFRNQRYLLKDDILIKIWNGVCV